MTVYLEKIYLTDGKIKKLMENPTMKNLSKALKHCRPITIEEKAETKDFMNRMANETNA